MSKYICGIYLGACRAEHPDHLIMYQDINGKKLFTKIVSLTETFTENEQAQTRVMHLKLEYKGAIEIKLGGN